MRVAMPINGKTADQLREEFYEAMRRSEERHARAEERHARLEERHEHAEERRKQVMAEADKRAEERHEQVMKDHAEAMKRQKLFEEDMRRRWKKITGEWGRFNNDEGGMVEYEGAAALRDLGAIGGMPIEYVLPPLRRNRKDREYDGVIQFPEAVALLEFKRRLTREDVRKFLDEQLPGFLRDFPKVVNGGPLYGAVAGATIDPDAERLAKDNDLFVVRIPANRRAVIVNNRAQPRQANAATAGE